MHFHVRQKFPEKIIQLAMCLTKISCFLLFGANKERAEVAFELGSWLRLVVAFVQLEFVHPADERTLLAAETLHGGTFELKLHFQIMHSLIVTC
jgi:hypothetical protein